MLGAMTQSASESVLYRYRYLFYLAVVIASAYATIHYIDNRNQHTSSVQRYMNPLPASVSGQYLMAQLARHEDEPYKALNYLEDVAELSPTIEPIQGEIYMLSLRAGKIDDALKAAESIPEEQVERLPLSPVLLEAVLAIKAQDYATAQEKLKKQPETGMSGLVATLLSQWVHLGLNEPVNAPVLQKLLSQSNEFRVAILYQIGLIYHMAAHQAETEETRQYAMRQANLFFSQLTHTRILPHHMRRKVGAYLRQHLPDLWEKFKTTHPDPLFTDTKDNTVLEKTNAPLSPVEGSAEVFFGLASILIAVEANDAAWIPLQVAHQLDPKNSAVSFVKAQLLEQKGKNEEALEIFASLQHDAGYSNMATIRRVYLLQQMGRETEARLAAQKLANAAETDEQTLLAYADILRNQERFAEAIIYYSKAIDRIETKETHHWSYYYSRGISYERNDQWPQAEADFNEALRLYPDQPDVLNYLGYSWLIQNKNLETAKKMIEKAITARPRDAHIIDSMGWALYRLGEYEEAVTYLERALDIEPRDPTINEHLGDVYWRMGFPLQARYQWERALTFNPTEKGQKEGIQQKLEQGLDHAETK